MPLLHLTIAIILFDGELQDIYNLGDYKTFCTVYRVLAYPPKTGPLTRLGFPCNSSPQLQEKSNEEEAVYGRADCADASSGPGSRPDGGPGLQGARHLGTDVVSLEE